MTTTNLESIVTTLFSDPLEGTREVEGSSPHRPLAKNP
jgi:hypothetical protein